MCSTPDVEANLERAASLTAAAVERGAELVLLPEAFAFMGPEQEKPPILEPLPEGGPILERCRAIARHHGCPLILGFHERAPEPGKAFNSCVHVEADGTVAAVYRKWHLFDVALADGTVLQESAHTMAGDEIVVTTSAFGPIGLSICYDLRFPELYREQVRRGATALAIPSAFTVTTGRDHWHVLLRARAIEAQSYVLAPAQWGRHYEGRSSYGHALIVDPWGCVIAECGDGEGVAVADLEPQRVARIRSELPSLRHRRM